MCNDWGGAHLVVEPGRSDRVSRLVLVSCEAFDNYPLGLPGRLLCLSASVLGGLFVTAQMLRFRWLRHLPFTFSNLSKKRVSDERFLGWNDSLRRDHRVRRDLRNYPRHVPSRRQVLDWVERQGAFRGSVLIVWVREDRLMPPVHAERLAKHFENSLLLWLDDSFTLIPIDQPEVLVRELRKFLGNATG